MRILSATTPSGTLHIGHYLGALRQWKTYHEKHDMLFCIADMHAITVPQDPEILRAKIFELATLYLAAGLDPQESIIFQQSQVSEHAELQWVLNTLTPLGELERMTQFKEKAGTSGRIMEFIKDQFEMLERLEKTTIKVDNKEYIQYQDLERTLESLSKVIETRSEASTGLLNYPILMAADILLYQTEEVPVGADQVQHIEFARMIAEKFNSRFGETFVVPKAKVSKDGARVMSLQDPTKKMSKSDPDPDGYIALLDDGATIMKKLKKAVTDSEKEVRYDPKQKPAISNLMDIYSAFSGKTHKEIEEAYKGKTYSEFKETLAEILTHSLMPLQERYKALSARPEEVHAVLLEGKERAKSIAQKTLTDVYARIGFTLHA